MIFVMRIVKLAAMAVIVTLVAACSNGPVPSDFVNDPLEGMNRQIHAFNILADKTVLRPVALAYGSVVPDPVLQMVNNSAGNLSAPKEALNHFLQGNIKDALGMSVRFVLNSTLGVAGLLDPASDVGLFNKPTDFGETLAAWGFAEGPYLELPILGANTVRSTVGIVVDYSIDPLRFALSDQDRNRLLILKGANLVGDRYAYSDLVDMLLYQSSDSYAAQRISYLQNMRRNQQGETDITNLEDPYAFE